MLLALSIGVLFISLMQLVHGVRLLIIMSFRLFAAATAADVFGAVLVALTSVYASLQSYKLDLALKF